MRTSLGAIVCAAATSWAADVRAQEPPHEASWLVPALHGVGSPC